nr:MOSC N-terminal beta barrel domain-containing protein [uncultured Carboxylicivirga sp.]
MYLTQITVYPIKSMGGVRMQQCELDDFGLKYDRRWMVVDTEGNFVTQRQNAHMCFFVVELKENGLEIKKRRLPDWSLHVPFQPVSERTMDVKVWSDVVKARIVDENIDKELSKIFEHQVHLVMMPDDAIRKVDTRYAPEGSQTAFSDGYPVLMISEESLDLLNSKLDTSVEMERFRPNLVISGGEPHTEDRKGRWKIGEALFEGVKPCSRCVITTINRDTAEKSTEPLKTLSTYRLQRGKVMFGMNLLHKTKGIVRVGDFVEFMD